MRKIIIHIGQPKTGTTALQRALIRNRRPLLRQGFLYPKPKFGNNHGVLTVPFARGVQRSMVAHLGKDYQQARQVGMDHWRAVAAEAARNPDTTLVLSSEFFFAAPDLGQLPGLIGELFGTEAQIEFVAYLRTPSEHFISLVQQKLKASHKLPPPGHGRLKRLKDLALIAPVHVRKFARDTLTDGDIVADFCAYSGIDRTRFRRAAGEANISICAEGMVLIQDYRRRHHADASNVFTKDTNRLLRAIAAEEAAHPGCYTRPRLRPEFAQWMDQDTPILTWLNRKYGVDLRKDHGVPADLMRDVAGVEDVTDLVAFDPDALARLRSAVGL